MQSQSTIKRVAVLRLKPEVEPDDIPHEIRIAGGKALVVVPGRAPLCLRCGNKGHIIRMCRVPRYRSCRRFGHESAQCVKTYAVATAPLGNEEKSELIMNEAEAEETAHGGNPDLSAKEAPATPSASQGGNENRRKSEQVALAALSATDGAAPTASESKVSHSAAEPAASQGNEKMEVDMAASATVKQAHEHGANEGQGTGATSGEPPPKAGPLRRSMLKLKPNIPPDGTPAATPPT